MKVTQEETVNRQAVLEIELDPEEMEPFLDRAYRRLVQRAAIPGFRKGKAPRRVLERYMGRGALLSEAIDFLIPETTAKAVDEQELVALGAPDIDIIQVDPTILKATVPLKPAVDLGDYLNLRIEEEESSENLEDEVQHVIQELRRNSAPWEPVERPVQEDDLITMHVLVEVDGDVLTDQKDVPYVVQKELDRPFPGFAGHLEDIAPEETKEFTVTLPDDYQDPNVAGKEANFTVTVLDVKEKKLAELDDEFAKGIGAGYENLEALTEQITQDLMARQERNAEQQFQELVLSAVIEGSTVELPPLLVEHQVDHLLNEQQQQLSQGGATLDGYLEAAGKTLDELREEAREEATRVLSRAWILTAISEEQELEVTSDEVDFEIAQLAGGVGQETSTLWEAFNNQGARDSISRIVLTRKANERLTQIARGQANIEIKADEIVAEEAPSLNEEQDGQENTKEGDTADAG